MNAETNHPRKGAMAQAALSLTARAPAGSCPAPEDIAAWHEGRLASEASERVQDHVAHCENCFALWHGLLEVERSAPARVDVRRRQPGLFGLPVWSFGLGGVAAAVLVAVMIANLDAGLPAYELSVQGQLQMRGEAADPGTVRLVEGNRFELLLRPATAVDENLEARVWVLRDGAAEPLAAPEPVLLDAGVVLLEGEVGRDVRVPGDATELVVVLGRSGKLPEASDAVRALAGGDQAQRRNWSAWRVPVVLEF